MWGQIGGAIGNFIVQSKMAASKKEWQEYNNGMLRLQNAQNQNAITQNATMTIEAGVMTKLNLERSRKAAAGKAEAFAAAAGVGGGSVKSTLFGLKQNQLAQELAQTQNTERQLAAIEVQRMQSSMSAVLQTDHTDYSVNPMNLVAGIFGAVASNQVNPRGPQSIGTQGLMI